MIWSSGDSAWADGKDYRADLTNLKNTWGQMTYGKMIAGCAAALTTETGKIAYLGPLTNDETRRLVNAAFLGAQYCWENVRGNSAADLEFAVTFIGFWFELPGLTLDPVLVVNDFIDGGADVTLSGIDANVALIRTGQRADAGETLWAVPYDFIGACDEAPDVCLGVPTSTGARPISRPPRKSSTGTSRRIGTGTSPTGRTSTTPTRASLGSSRATACRPTTPPRSTRSSPDWPMGRSTCSRARSTWQDGTQWLGDGEKATLNQIWYSEQCLEGIEGICSVNIFG